MDISVLTKRINFESSPYRQNISCAFDVDMVHLVKTFTNVILFQQIFNTMDNLKCRGGENRLNCKNSLFSFYINSKACEFTIDEVIETLHYQKLNFLFSRLFDRKINFIINFKFYRLTVEDATYFSMELIYASENDLAHFYTYLPIPDIIKAFRNISDKLNKKKKYKEYSINLNSNIFDIWSLITDWNVLTMYVPTLADYVEYPQSQDCDKIKIMKGDKILYIRIKRCKLEAYKGLYTINIYYDELLIQKIIFKLVSNDMNCFVHIKYIQLKAFDIGFVFCIKEILNSLKYRIDKRVPRKFI
jgi:hypothetical protein